MKVNFESIYEHIGHLFYAIAFDREYPTTAKVVKLTEIIERTWKAFTSSDPGLHLHLVDCIHEGVRYALENGMSSEEALSSFSNYYQIHSLPFSQSLKEKIMTTVITLLSEFPSRAFGGEDKSVLAQLLKVSTSPV